MTAPSDSITRRIQALMERAMHPATPEEERESAQAMADKLMAKYRVDAAMLDFGKKENERREPVVHHFDPIKIVDESSLRASSRDTNEYSLQGRLTGVRAHIFSHCGCKARSSFKEGKRVYTVIGYQEDVFFAELLWNTVFMDIVSKMYPSWNKEKSFDANVFDIKKAGYSWSQVREIGLANGGRDHNGPLTFKNAGSKLRTAYKREASRRGEVVLPGKQQPTDPHWWRQSFCQAYIVRLEQRLRAMENQHEEYKGIDNLPAMQQSEEWVLRKYWEQFPDEHPDAVAERMKKWREEDAKLEAEYRSGARKRPRSRSVSMPRMRQADGNAWSAGHEAANQVNLSTAKAAGDKKEELR